MAVDEHLLEDEREKKKYFLPQTQYTLQKLKIYLK